MTERFLKRPLSHSQLASWEYSPEQWYERYILGKRFEGNPATRFGNTIGDLLGTPDSPIPELREQGVKEYKVTGEVEGIKLIGYLDGWCEKTNVLHENKTSDNPKRWNQKKADTHSQIDMYLLLLNQQDGVPPELVTSYLNFIQTRPTGLGYRLHKEPKWSQYQLRTRTMTDLDEYVSYIVATVEAMDEYAKQRSQLSTPAPVPPVLK